MATASQLLRSPRILVLLVFAIASVYKLVDLVTLRTAIPIPNNDIPELYSHLLMPPLYMATISMTRFNRPMLDVDSKLLYCWLPKVACTQFKSLFCRHAGTPQSSINNPNIIKQHLFAHYKCSLQNVTRYDPTKDEATLRDSAWHKWATVRHPIDKFVSGWMDKCARQNSSTHCYACHGSLSCFLNQHSQNLRLIHDNGAWPVKGTGHIDHFMPQYWYCGFSQHLAQYEKIFVFSKDQEFAQEVRSTFKSIGWPSSILDEGWGEDGKAGFLDALPDPEGEKKKQSYGDLKDKLISRIKTDPAIAETILRVYLVDFIAFNFHIPEAFFALCTSCPVQTCSLWLICNEAWIERERLVFAQTKTFPPLRTTAIAP